MSQQVQCTVCDSWYPASPLYLGMNACSSCGASVKDQQALLGEGCRPETSDPDELPEPAPGDVEVPDGFEGLFTNEAIVGTTDLLQTIACCIQETVTHEGQLTNLRDLYTALGLQSVWDLAAAAIKADREWEDEDEENLEALFDPGSP